MERFNTKLILILFSLKIFNIQTLSPLQHHSKRRKSKQSFRKLCDNNKYTFSVTVLNKTIYMATMTFSGVYHILNSLVQNSSKGR